MFLTSNLSPLHPLSFTVFWYLWWVGWIGVVGNLGVVCWWLGGGSMSRQEHNRTTTRWHSETATRQHRKKTTRQDGKTAGQHDKNTATQQPNNPTTNWCGPVECAKRLNHFGGCPNAYMHWKPYNGAKTWFCLTGNVVSHFAPVRIPYTSSFRFLGCSTLFWVVEEAPGFRRVTFFPFVTDITQESLFEVFLWGLSTFLIFFKI